MRGRVAARPEGELGDRGALDGEELLEKVGLFFHEDVEERLEAEVAGRGAAHLISGRLRMVAVDGNRRSSGFGQQLSLEILAYRQPAYLTVLSSECAA